MIEFVAALALIAAIMIGVNYDFHKEGFLGFIAFLLIYGLAFVVIGAILGYLSWKAITRVIEVVQMRGVYS